MKRLLRPIVAVAAATLATAGIAVVTAAPASAAVIGQIKVRINGGFTTGDNESLFGGTIDNAQCPVGTVDSFFSIDGPDLPGAPDYGGALGPGTTTGTGKQEFSGASIANLKTNNAGSFSADNSYQMRFNCFDLTGVATDTYEATLTYKIAGPGSFTFSETPVTSPPPPVTPPSARGTATTLTAVPAGPVVQGTTVDLTADVTPTTGADDPTGSVEFFNGSTSLGVDNTLTGTGVGTLAVSSLPVGVNSITAVFTPATGAQLKGSTSAPAIVKVTPVVAPPPVIPEAPFVVLLPLAAAGIAFAALRRRRLAA